MDTLIRIIQVILALSVLIIIHEFGHFMWARLFKIRVEKFYLFFDVGGKAIVRWKWGDTEFGIGWLPFGGYCKISGMVDESMDTEQLKQAPKPWEYRSKPAWQRLFVIAGGVLNNFIFAILCYIAIMAIWGSAYISNEDSQVYVNDLAYEMGFRNGDKILSFDDYVPEDFGMLQADLARRDVHKVTVLRDADTVRLYIDKSMISDVLNSPLMFDLAVPFVVDSVMAGGPNAGSDLRKGDKIVAIDGESFSFMQEARPVLAKYKGMDTEATVIRDGDTVAVPVRVDTSGVLGVTVRTPNVKVQKYNVATAIPAGLKMTGETINGYLQDLKLLVQPSTGAYKSVGSFVAIGEVFPTTWDWYRFLNITALLSIMLGVLNLIPIPGLDGGHILFTLYEMITRRKPSEKFLVVAQTIGMVLIMALMMLAVFNDIGRLIR